MHQLASKENLPPPYHAFSDESSPHSAESTPHSDVTPHSDESTLHSDEPAPHSDDSTLHSDESSPLGDKSTPHRNEDPLVPAPQYKKDPMGQYKMSTLTMALFFGVMPVVFLVGIFFGDKYSESRRTATRQSWQDELDSHLTRQNQMARENELWKVETQEREHVRYSWSVEKAAHEVENGKWESERQERQKERRKEERKRKRKAREEEEDARLRMGLVWEERKAGGCSAYGTRRHLARLGHIPDGYDGMKGCPLTPMEIHGRTLLPNECFDKNGVWGVWYVDFNEPTCTTYWSDVKDKGCTAPGSGQRRFEARLDNLHSEDDWQEMCGATPARISNLELAGPKACVDWGIYGKYGIWELDSHTCR